MDDGTWSRLKDDGREEGGSSSTVEQSTRAGTGGTCSMPVGRGGSFFLGEALLSLSVDDA